MPTSTLLGTGIYLLPVASRLTGVPARSIRRWVSGYKFQYRGDVHTSPPVFPPDISPINGELAISFLDLIEIHFVHAFRKHGVSWKTIRLAAEKAARLTNSTHPFATTRFKTDGKTIFAELVSETKDRALLELVRDQYAIAQVISPSLFAELEFDANNKDRLIRWWPSGKKAEVVIDPQRSFGQPIVNSAGVSTRVLKGAFDVEKSVAKVAKWYDVDKKSVKDAVAFERRIAA